jgi:hypothetical protein
MRDAAAMKVKAKAEHLSYWLKKLVPEESRATPYFHLLTCHLHDQVREFGSMFGWSGEGLEHLNFIIKKIQRHMVQKGKRGDCNGGRRARDGSQNRRAPGRVGQALLWSNIVLEAGPRVQRAKRKSAEGGAARNWARDLERLNKAIAV